MTAELDRVDSIQTALGLGVEDIAQAGREVFFSATGQKASEEMPDYARDNWDAAATCVFRQCMSEIEVSWKALAERACNAFYDASKYSELPLIMQRIWEVVVRHMANCVIAEDRDELKEAQAFDWKKWIVKGEIDVGN
jgi:hypothetical protein